MPRVVRGPSIAAALNVPVAALFRDDLVFEVVVSPETLEEIRLDGRAGARNAAERLAKRLEPSLYEFVTKPTRDLSAGAAAKPRKTRVERLQGVAQANAKRKAALERRRLEALS
jgi:hypothetical protein